MSKIFLKDKSGATAIEYAFIAALISLVILTSGSHLAGALNGKFQAMSDAVNQTDLTEQARLSGRSHGNGVRSTTQQVENAAGASSGIKKEGVVKNKIP